VFSTHGYANPRFRIHLTPVGAWPTITCSAGAFRSSPAYCYLETELATLKALDKLKEWVFLSKVSFYS